MPMDNLIYQAEIPWDDATFKRRCIGWELKLSIWPRRCYYSNKRIWGNAYRGTAMVTGPGEPVFETRWCHRDEYLFLKIKGIV